MPTPATRIDWIPVDLIDLHPLARAHSPEGLASLVKNLQKQGQLQNIVVCPVTPHPASGHPLPEGEGRGEGLVRYQVIAGAGRFQQIRELKWEKILASVREGLSEFEKLDLMLSENEEREPEGPVHKAKVYKAMKEAGNMTVRDLAKDQDLDESDMGRYLSLAEFPLNLQESLDRSRLSMAHIKQIMRLTDCGEQISMTEKCAQEEWSTTKLKAEVIKRLGGKLKRTPVPGPKPAGFSFKQQGPRVVVTSSFSGDDLLQLDAWWDKLRGAIVLWAGQHPQRITGDGEQGSGDRGPEKLLGEPTIEKGCLADIRLPGNPGEEAELQAAAKQGPAAFYRWILGPEAAQEVEGQSWKDHGFSDPLEACRQLVNTLRQQLPPSRRGAPELEPAGKVG